MGTTELLLVLVVIIMLFGAKRLPGAARSLGQSLRIFKAETKGLRADDDGAAGETQRLEAAVPAQPVTAEPPRAEHPA